MHTKKINPCFASSWLRISLSRNLPDFPLIIHIIGGLAINPANKIPYVANEDIAKRYNIPRL